MGFDYNAYLKDKEKKNIPAITTSKKSSGFDYDSYKTAVVENKLYEQKYETTEEPKVVPVEEESKFSNAMTKVGQVGLDFAKSIPNAAGEFGKDILGSAGGIMDFIGRAGLHITSGVGALTNTYARSMDKLRLERGTDKKADVDYDQIWKEELEKYTDRALDIGNPAEYFRAKVTGTEFKENRLLMNEAEKIAADWAKKYKAGEGGSSEAYLDLAKLAGIAFMRDWANPFWLFDIKGIKAGSGKFNFGEKEIGKMQINPAKKDFLIGSKVRPKTETKVFDLGVKQKMVDVSSKTGKAVPVKEPKLKIYVTGYKDGGGVIKVTNSGGKLINKELVNQVMSDIAGGTSKTIPAGQGMATAGKGVTPVVPRAPITVTPAKVTPTIPAGEVLVPASTIAKTIPTPKAPVKTTGITNTITDPAIAPKSSVAKFNPKSDNNITTTKGELTNSHWLLKPEYVKKPLLARIKANPSTLQNPETITIWENARKNNPTPVTEISGYTGAGYGEDLAYVVTTKAGENITLDKKYYDYLEKNIENFGLLGVNEKQPLIITSNGEEAGLLMPIKSSGDKKIVWTNKAPATGVKKGTVPKVKIDKPIVKMPKEKAPPKVAKVKDQAVKIYRGQIAPTSASTIAKPVRKKIKINKSGKVDLHDTVKKMIDSAKGEDKSALKMALDIVNDTNSSPEVIEDAINAVRQAGYEDLARMMEYISLDYSEIKYTDNFVKQLEDKINKISTTKTEKSSKTQTERVTAAVKDKPKSIREVARETEIKEPNVRRILGVGAKDGKFERVDKGVYVLKKDGQNIAYIEPGDALEVLPRLAKEGFKADMIFLDIPYDTPAVKGGNRGVKYNLVSPKEFEKLLPSIAEIAEVDAPIVYMYSQAKSGLAKMGQYNDLMAKFFGEAIGKGEYTKLQKDGVTRVRNMRGNIIEPEGIIIFAKDEAFIPDVIRNIKNRGLNFKLVRPRGYQTEKPAEMLRELIEMTTKKGDMVLDPFAGSGVTGEQAVKSGRKAYMVEKNQKAIDEHIKPRLEKAVVKKEPIKIKHFTKKENVEKILKDGFDTSLDPIFGTGIKSGGKGKGKFGKDILYFTADDARWKSAYVYVGKGDAVPYELKMKRGPNDSVFYDYEKQKYMIEKDALKKVDLSPVNAEIKADSKILKLDSTKSVKDFLGEKFPRQFIDVVVEKAKKEGYDIVNIRRGEKGAWPLTEYLKGKGLENAYDVYTGGSGDNDYFILNKDSIEIQKSEEAINSLKIPNIEKLHELANKYNFEDFYKKLGVDGNSDIKVVIDKMGISNDKQLLDEAEYNGEVSLEDLWSIIKKGKYYMIPEEFNKMAEGEVKKLDKFLKGKDPMKAGKIKAVLNKEIVFRDKGKTNVMTRGEKIEEMAKNGTLKIDSYETNKIKEMSRMQNFKADNKEQAAHEIKIKEGGKKTIYLTGGYDMGKIGYDYGKFLLETTPKIPIVRTNTTKVPKRSSFDLAPGKGGAHIKRGDYEVPKRGVKPTGKVAEYKGGFKIYEEVKAMIQKYAVSIGEDYTPRGAAGVHYTDSGNIRVKNMNDISLAAHEMTHFLDTKYNITEGTMEVTGYDRLGRPRYSAKTSGIRKDLRKLYTEYYPGASPNAKLKTVIREGFAMLYELYIVSPSTIEAGYPNLIKEFLKHGGKFYKPVASDMVNDFRNIISTYDDLTALEKINAIMVTDEIDVNKPDFLSLKDKIKTTVADDIYPIEVVAKKTGVHFTDRDPSLWLRAYRNVNEVVYRNIMTKKGKVFSGGYWGWRKGKFIKLQEENWRNLTDYMTEEKALESFPNWLISRRVYFDYKKLDVAKVNMKNLAQQIKELGGMKEVLEYDGGKKLLKEFETAVEKYKKLKTIVDNDGITRTEATEAYIPNKEGFAKLGKLFDSLVREDLNFAHEVGFVNDAKFKEYKAEEGYATFMRYFGYDEITGKRIKGRGKMGGTKVSSLKERTGSGKDIMNVVDASIKNHVEMTRKGMVQIVYNKMGSVFLQHPKLGIAQKLPLNAVGDNPGPEIMMSIINGKKVPFLVDATIMETLTTVINVDNLHFVEQLLTTSSRLFTKGTTGWYVAFAPTNFAVDQITAAAQTKYNVAPVIGPLKEFLKAVNGNSAERANIEKYIIMGGARQTFAGHQNMTPREFFNFIEKEKTGLKKATALVESGFDILSKPSEYSEIVTRATEFSRAKKEGDPDVVAFERAGRVSAPFHHIGAWGGKTGQVYLKSLVYTNAGIQVLAQAAETINSPGGAMRYAFVAMAVSASMMGGLALMISQSTDDQKRQYKDLKPGELARYIWYPKLDGKTLGRVRVPEQMVPLTAMINMTIADKFLDTNYTTMEYITAAAEWVPNQINPLNLTQMALSFLPHIIATNVATTFGVKTYPDIHDIESPSEKAKLPKYRYNEATSVVAKKMGKELNISPMKIDAYIMGNFGRAAGYLMGKPGAYNLLGGFSKEYYVNSGRTFQKYYDIREENGQIYDELKNSRKALDDYKREDITAYRLMIKRRIKIKAIDEQVKFMMMIDPEKNYDAFSKERAKALDMMDAME